MCFGEEKEKYNVFDVTVERSFTVSEDFGADLSRRESGLGGNNTDVFRWM